MVQDGWKVEMKSKYQTLSTCAEYLKHLIKVTKEKEEKLAKTKADLSIRDQKLKEDKVLQDSRSDPESVTSSLTAFSTSTDNVQVASTVDTEKNTNIQKYVSHNTSEGSSNQMTKKQCVDDGSGISSESGYKGKDISVNKMSSSLSDMTDSNKGSSDGKGSNIGSESNRKAAVLSNEVSSHRSGEVEVSSTAAVVSGIGSQEHGHEHADIVIKMGPRDRKRKRHEEKNSLEEGFVLNYEEVFMSSNVPQFIVTLAGRIITCNEMFYCLTGLSKQDVKRITIFSLVQAENLSDLYELVAEFLRKGNSQSDGNTTPPSLCLSDNNETIASGNSYEQSNFKTLTLPCIQFPKNLPLNHDGSQRYRLFMHVTVIWDKIPSRRCLHCALSDQAEKKGKIGFLSSSLFHFLLN